MPENQPDEKPPERDDDVATIMIGAETGDGTLPPG